MKQTSLDINHLAKLAKLRVSKDESKHYQLELNKILELVDQLKSIDTRDIEPMAHPLNLAQYLRADHITEHDQSEVFQSIAPKTDDHLYLVPKTLSSD